MDWGEITSPEESEPPEALEILSEGEKRFEIWLKRIGLFLGPALGLSVYLLPFPGLSDPAHVLAAILAWVVIYWMTEPIPIPTTALLGPTLCAAFGIGTPKEVFAPFAHPIIFLFIGSFFIARATQLHGLDRRFALFILSTPWIGGSPYRILFALGAITAFLSMWLSNTAATAMMLPIGLGILSALKRLSPESMNRYSTGLMLMTAYAASIGGLATLIGTPPNLIGVGLIQEQIGVKISFLRWTALGLPIFLLMYLVLYVLLVWFHKPERTHISGVDDYIRSRRHDLGGWHRGQVNTAVAFLAAVLLWSLPGPLALFLGTDHPGYVWFDAHFHEGVSALLASSLLFLLPVNLRQGKPTLPWRQAASIDWGTILLFGGGLALGQLMFQTGLSAAVGRGAVHLFAVNTLWGITALAIAVGIISSELTSNTASATMVIPVMIAIADSVGVSPLPPALGACLGASFGFMLPVSTPPNAIVYGSGLVPIHRMARTGIVFDLLGFFLIWIALRILTPLLGLQ